MYDWRGRFGRMRMCTFRTYVGAHVYVSDIHGCTPFWILEFWILDFGFRANFRFRILGGFQISDQTVRFGSVGWSRAIIDWWRPFN